MALKRMQLSTWERLTKDGTPDELLGLSPGGAASTLGISRQGVHEAIRRGKLDAFAVYHGVRLRFFIVRADSIQRYHEERLARTRQLLDSIEKRA